ncbi:MAG: hypothetical protein DRI61_16055, partial [Chloroflexi bacterium]
MDFIKKNIKKNDKTPLPIQAKIQIEGQEAEIEGITLGMLAEELRERNYQVIVNSRTGHTVTATLEKFFNERAVSDASALAQ